MKVSVFLFDGRVIEFPHVTRINRETDEVFKFNFIDRVEENQHSAVFSMMNIAGYEIEYLS